MSILGNIFSKLMFHHQQAVSPAAPPGPAPTPAHVAAPAPETGAPATPAAPPAAAAATVTRLDDVDVTNLLDGLAAKNPQKLDWRHSIVDFLKLLDLDSSLTARKDLAKELSFTGDTNDSAKMNVWLHGQVFQKLAANGGKVPPDLAK